MERYGCEMLKLIRKFEKVDFKFKGCVHYIFASLFFKSKLEHLSNWERYFLFHSESSFCSQENQILEFYILKLNDVIKCLKHKTRNTFY